ncbi:MAG: replication protein [Dehalococcoidia bacterium]|nr:replication protein [Dehalococcoidia bacterium]
MAASSFVFEGFSAPGYTQVPDEFFDVCLHALSGAETKVMCYLFRRTFGWKKDADAVSLSQITDGIVRRDGARLDFGAGVSRETAINALKGLEAKGLIVRQPQTREDGGVGTTVYRIRFRGQSADPTGPVAKPDRGESDRPTPPVNRSDSGAVARADQQDPHRSKKQGQQPTDTKSVNWEAIQTALRARFTRANFETYIAPLRLAQVRDGVATLIAPNAFVGDWVRDRFSSAIAAAFTEAIGAPTRIDVRAA